MTPDPRDRLAVRALRKRFGPVEAVRDASFDVRVGEVVGLLGPNGAGKSTILECLAGLLPVDHGTVLIDGVPVPPDRRHESLFYLPDGLIPWREARGGDLLDFTAAVWNVPPAHHRQWQSEAAVSLDVDALLDRRIGELSKGQRKRLLLGVSLLVPRPVVLMDEPFDGLDLRQTRETIALFRNIARGGRSLLVSIHAMGDAERTCDRLVLVSDGRTCAEGTLGALREQSGLVHGAIEDVFLALT